MRVVKFGGTSVGSTTALKHMLDIILTKLQLGEQVIIICSAMSTVTDLLFDAAALAASGAREYQQLINRIYTMHTNTINTLIKPGTLREQALAQVELSSDQLADTITQIFNTQNLDEKMRDAVLSFGELLSCNMIALYLQDNTLPAQFVDARKLIKTDNTFGNAKVDFIHTEANLKQWVKQLDYLPIVTGYIASDSKSAVTTTLGRGGSDYTATIIGAVLNADLVEIWTDVNGVMTADPKHVKDTCTIPELSYAEAIQLSQNGAKVIYSASLYPVQEKNIPLVVKNTFNADHAGTLIN